jgi:hypothetical protein
MHKLLRLIRRMYGSEHHLQRCQDGERNEHCMQDEDDLPVRHLDDRPDFRPDDDDDDRPSDRHLAFEQKQ